MKQHTRGTLSRWESNNKLFLRGEIENNEDYPELQSSISWIATSIVFFCIITLFTYKGGSKTVLDLSLPWYVYLICTFLILLAVIIFVAVNIRPAKKFELYKDKIRVGRCEIPKNQLLNFSIKEQDQRKIRVHYFHKNKQYNYTIIAVINRLDQLEE